MVNINKLRDEFIANQYMTEYPNVRPHVSIYFDDLVSLIRKCEE